MIPQLKNKFAREALPIPEKKWENLLGGGGLHPPPLAIGRLKGDNKLKLGSYISPTNVHVYDKNFVCMCVCVCVCGGGGGAEVMVGWWAFITECQLKLLIVCRRRGS